MARPKFLYFLEVIVMEEMSKVQFDMACFICKVDEIIKDSIDFEAAQSGSSELELWKKLRPLLRSYVDLIETVEDVQDNLRYERTAAAEREERLETKLDEVIRLLNKK